MYFIEGHKPLMLLTQQHNNCCPFRKGLNLDLLWFDPEDDVWKYLEHGKKRKNSENRKTVKRVNDQVKEQRNYRCPDQSYFAPSDLDRYSPLYERWQEQLAQRGLDKPHVVNALPLSAGDTFEDGKHLYYSDLTGWLFTK